MSYSFPADIARLVQAQMQTGHFATEDDLLRDALTSYVSNQQLDVDEQDDTFAIQGALDSVAAGKQGRPVREVFNELRRELGLPEEP